MPSERAAHAPAQTQGPAPVFDGARAWQDIQRQVALGPRPAGSSALAQTRRFIEEQLKAAGLVPTQQGFIAKTPLGEMSMANIVATIPGRRPDRIIVASHFDTKLAKDFRFVGANDGASSTAALLELARALAGRQRELTIELLFLDGEEAINWEWQGTDNTYGSRHYVQAAQKAGTLQGIKALVLLDMIADKDLVIRRDSNSTPWLVDIIWGTASRLGHRGIFSNELTTIEDDHIQFLRAGVPAVDIIDLEYAEWNTPRDDLDHISQKSLQVVGDVVLASLPEIEKRITSAAK